MTRRLPRWGSFPRCKATGEHDAAKHSSLKCLWRVRPRGCVKTAPSTYTGTVPFRSCRMAADLIRKIHNLD
eukprot:4423565-Prymnesium_polylepis.1